jgi:4-hydroxy-tetrahydrodipicolinate reductase
MSVRVAVAGAAGRMGRTVVRAVHEDPETELVAAIDVQSAGRDAGELAGLGTLGIPVSGEIAVVEAAQADVLVDFTRAASAHDNATRALRAGISPVIGTTGLSREQEAEIASLASEAKLGAFIAPNFSIGAVLMMLFARQAARYLPEIEIIEMHGEQKVDAPSGTAMRTIQLILENRGERTAKRPEREEFKVEGARGGDVEGIRVHSVRLPGYVAHQECIFGGIGQTLTLRHDSMDRISFMPGVVLACKRVRDLDGLVVGLEHLLDL